MNLSAITDFLSLYVEDISIPFFSNHDLTDLLQNLLPLSATHFLFGILLDYFKIFSTELVIVIPFLSFKGITQAYLL